ncbi:DnaJ domain-containing protein [Halobacteriales archaeon Cl-PHB]
MSRADRTGGEIDWPGWAERTASAARSRTSKFSVTLAQAINRIEAALMDRLEADDWRLSTAAPHRKKDGRPYADANPDDPGAVLRWSKGGEQYAVACDHYDALRDNVRAIGLYIEEKRKMSNRPVVTGQDEFATARLPGGDQDAIAPDPPAHEVLGVAEDAPERVVKAAYQEKVKEVHPDAGGSKEEFQRVERAREAMLDE